MRKKTSHQRGVIDIDSDDEQVFGGAAKRGRLPVFLLYLRTPTESTKTPVSPGAMGSTGNTAVRNPLRGSITSGCLDWLLSPFPPSGPREHAAGLAPCGSDCGTDIADVPVLPEDVVIGEIESAPRDRTDNGRPLTFPKELGSITEMRISPKLWIGGGYIL